MFGIEASSAGSVALTWVVGLASLVGTTTVGLLIYFAKSWADRVESSLESLVDTVTKHRADLECKLDLTITRIHDRLDACSEDVREHEKVCYQERLNMHTHFASKHTVDAIGSALKSTEERVTKLERDVDHVKGGFRGQP